MKITPVLIPLFIILITLGTCSKKEKIPIAIMTRLEAGSIEGSSVVNTAKLFLEDHKNNAFEIIFFDDGCRTYTTAKTYQDIKKRGIKLLITTHISTCALAIRDQVNRDKTLTFETSATTDKLSKMDDYIFRNIPDVEKEQKNIAGYINSKGFRRLLIIRDTDNHEYTEPALKYFRAGLMQKETAVIDISIAKVNHGELLGKMKQYDFGSLYLLIGSNASGVGAIAQLAATIRPGLPIMYTPWVKSPVVLETAGTAIHHSIIPSHYPPRMEDLKKNAYIDRFKKRFGHSPISISLNVYSALEIIHQSIAAGNRDPDSIKKHILEKKIFHTEFGTVTFDKYGDADNPLYYITDITREF